MQEIIITKYGPPDVLKVREQQTPKPHKGDVVIRNYFSGVNFSEIMARMRLYPGAPKPPTTLGSEACGVIESVGEGVEKYKSGDIAAVIFPHMYGNIGNIDIQGVMFINTNVY